MRIEKKDFKYVYGPVPSRRLGESLGVNPIPLKTCNYSCVYCQLGRTKNLTNTRKDFFSPQEILAEIREAIELYRDKMDFITFVGEGEPTLCKSLGWLIENTRKLANIPIAVITNGALMYREDVREELLLTNVVMPSLDATDQETFLKINRPHRELRIDEIVEGMAKFRAMYKGQIWVEVMLVKGLNDTEGILEGIQKSFSRIKPDRVYLNVPIRPPAEPWVEIPDDEGLVRAQTILKGAIMMPLSEEGEFHIEAFKNYYDAILSIVRRHPMKREQIRETLKISEDELDRILKSLEEENKIRGIRYRGFTFYTQVETRYGAKK